MANDIRNITGFPDGLQPAIQPSITRTKTGPGFNQVLKNLVNEVDSLQKTAGQKTQKMLTGEIQDIHQVVVAVEEAAVSFRLLMEIRNKMVEAYREVMKMQV